MPMVRTALIVMQKVLRVRILPILIFFGLTVSLFFPFSAEDAFITYRYAENLATTGAFVFNEGEPITALTSPLHGLLSTLLFVLTGQTVLFNKFLGIALLLAAARMVWTRYQDQPLLQPLVAALTLFPSCIVLWTVGGLETPILLFLVTAATVVAADPNAPTRGHVCLVFFLAGAAFLTRFDSVLFMVPLALFVALRARTGRDIAIATVVGAALPAAWLLISWRYYGDILPTSYYSKTPRGNPSVMLRNGRYIVSYLFLAGILPVLLFSIALFPRWRTMWQTLVGRFKAMWWVYLGIAAQLLYGLTMAQTHMMFSFRSFVPYLPAFAIVAADLLGRAMEARQFSTARRASILTSTILGLMALQGFQVAYTYDRSVNGYYPRGEYRRTGVRQYATYLDVLRKQGEEVRDHWTTMSERQGRSPRIFTFAGGVLPYTYRDSYVYETLVSYRHCYREEDLIEAANMWIKTNTDLRLSADYIHIKTPWHGSIKDQLPLPEEKFSLVSSHEIIFEGEEVSFLVFYNPAPAPHTLTNRIDGLCP
jgi:arabinofuranosyltransferase